MINKVIKSFIDPKLLLVVALQASGLVNEEDKEEAKEAKETKETKETKKEVDEAFELESAQNSIKDSQLSLLLVERLSPFRSSSMLSQPSSLAI